MSKHTNQQTKKPKQEKKTSRKEYEKELLGLLSSLSVIKDGVEMALEEFCEDWPVERMRKFDGNTASSVPGTLKIALEEIDAALAELKADAPESVLKAFAIQEEEASQALENPEAHPEGIFKAQSKMRDSLMEILKVPHPATAACNAACGAAETVFLTGIGMAERTRAMALEVVDSFPDQPGVREVKEFLAYEAETVYAFSTDMLTAIYQDTCAEAMEICKALVEGPESIRRGQPLH